MNCIRLCPDVVESEAGRFSFACETYLIYDSADGANLQGLRSAGLHEVFK